MITKHQYIEYLISTPINYTCSNLAEHLEDMSAGPYTFPFTRLLATRWSRHPDFDPRWVRGSEATDR